jgi:hypothetical protein
MKQTPPLPPNNPRFRDDILYSGCIYYLCPGTQLIALNGGCEKIPDQWRPLIAADAEVSFRKEAEHEDRQGDHIASYKARQNARDWRSWAEPEEEADNEK